MELLLTKVDKCCCCLGINLRTGTLILLWFGIIYPSITLLVFLLSGVQGNASAVFGDGNNAIADVCVTIAFWFFFIEVFLFHFLPNALALYGVYKNKPNYLEPYVFLCMVGLLFSVVFLIIATLSMLIVGINYDRLENQLREMTDNKESYRGGIVALVQVSLFVSIITAAIGAALTYYFTSVVHSQYRKMKEEMNKHFGYSVHYDAYNPEIKNSKCQLNA